MLFNMFRRARGIGSRNLQQDLAKNGKDGLDFTAALDLLLNMRGGNAATVAFLQSLCGRRDFEEGIKRVLGAHWGFLCLL